MAPSTFVDMVRVASASAGVGPLVLGPPVTAFQGTTALIDGNQYSYSIQQEADDTWEYGQGVWTAATSTLARGVIRSSLGTSPIGLRAGTPISITVLAEDFAATDQAALAAAVASAQQSATDADADAVATAADRVQTGLDRTAAAGSATNAATSAGQSAASATAANNSAISAATDAATASAAVGTATSAATAAADSATTASNAASAAGTSATNAATSATAAAGSATAAAGSATTAGNNAASTAADRVQTGLDRTAAANSATSAGLSELNAANSATAAAGSATTAQNRATDAANSATDAANSATNAFNSATAAGTSAGNAATSATAAGTSATNAATSATTAGTSATNAAASATAAGTSATNAATSATTASGSATNAANSATAAAGSASTAASSATAAASQVSLAAAQAAIATTAASNPSFKIQTNPATPTVPPSGVNSGDTYWAVDANPATKLTLYLNTSGTGAPTSTTVIDPLTRGTQYIGRGVPANNQYSDGDTYVDSLTGLKYGPKTNGAWPLGAVADVNAATPSRFKVDFTQSGAILPAAHWALTRTTSRTDMTYLDDYTYAYNTYGSGVPVIRAGKGLGVWQAAQQLLANPAAPVTETLTLNNTGVYIVTGWGPPGSAQGVAFGTGTGTITDPSLATASSLAGNGKSFLIITMTSTGTVIFTPSGGLTKANVTINPLSGGTSLSQPVPYIPTQTTVNADWEAGTSTFNALIGAPKGYFVIGVSEVTGAKNYARLPSPLGLNGITAGYVASDTTYNFFDVASHAVNNNSTGNFAFSTGVVMARTWDTSQPTVTYGAGDRVENIFGFTHNNGVAVTASCLGGAATTGTYANYAQINGWITGYEIATEARLTDEALYNLYSQTPLPTLDALIKGYTSPSQFKKFLSAYRKMKAGVTDFVPIVVNGPSHEAGYLSPAPANVRAYSWPYQMVTDLIAQGYAITDDTFCGPNNYTDGATGYTGTNQYDSRITYSGTAPTKTGRQIGGEVIVIPAGTTRTFTPSRGNTSRFIMGVYTAASGYGSVEVSTDGGTTALVATETGVATNSTTAAPSLITLTFNQTLGANAWTIKAVGGPVHLSFGQAYNPAAKQIVVFNTARDNWKINDLARNIAPENSHLLGITKIAPALAIGNSDQTNDMGSGGTAYSSYSADQNTVLANVLATADVVLFIDPRSNPSTFAQTVQDTITNYARAIGADSSVVLYDLFSWKTYAILGAAGMYSASPLAGSDNLHLGPQGLKRLKSNQIGDLLKRILAVA